MDRWDVCCVSGFIIPQRYVLGIMGFLAIVNAYNMRVCLSIAINHMVVPITKNTSLPDECPPLNINDTNDDIDLTGRYKWDSDIQGSILSSFFWGYVVTHMPGGILAEKFGGKHSLGIGILGTTIFTLLTPIVVHKWEWQGLIAIRVIEGLGEVSKYFDVREKCLICNILGYDVSCTERSTGPLGSCERTCENRYFSVRRRSDRYRRR